MDKKLRNDIAMFLLGASDMPKGMDRHIHNATVATNRLKTTLDNPRSQNDLADKIRDRQTSAGIYTVKTKMQWPF
tara:strand:+ start:172 stop:396 length:225 start_codon:yes stop_codon:yes gene_type:complete